jgi:hypothetical protein
MPRNGLCNLQRTSDFLRHICVRTSHDVFTRFDSVFAGRDNWQRIALANGVGLLSFTLGLNRGAGDRGLLPGVESLAAQTPGRPPTCRLRRGPAKGTTEREIELSAGSEASHPRTRTPTGLNLAIDNPLLKVGRAGREKKGLVKAEKDETDLPQVSVTQHPSAPDFKA